MLEINGGSGNINVALIQSTGLSVLTLLLLFSSSRRQATSPPGCHLRVGLYGFIAPTWSRYLATLTDNSYTDARLVSELNLVLSKLH